MERERTIKLLEKELKTFWLGYNSEKENYNEGIKRAIEILKTGIMENI